MSRRFRKQKLISEARRAAARANGAKSHGPVTSEGKAKSALNAVTHGLTATGLVLTTESKEKYNALLASYLDECDPQGPIENALVEQIVSAQWLHRRSLEMSTALLDVTMDRMQKEISEEFEHIDNAVRTALAFEKKAGESPALALLNRYAARHARDYHRALDKLAQIQSERREQSDAPEPLTFPNEPKLHITHGESKPPELVTNLRQGDNGELVTRHSSLATQPDHCFPNEPKPHITHSESKPPEVLTNSGQSQNGELDTRHPSLATQTGHRTPATDHCSPPQSGF
jgi:hypothetical protein